MRLIACAGAIAIGLVLGGAGAGLAMADPGESGGGAEGGATTSGTAETNSNGKPDGDSKPDTESPTSTVGSGRQDDERKPVEQEEKKPAPAIGSWPRFKHSLSIPVLRVPTPEEVAATGWTDPSVFFGTVEVPVPTIDGFLSALSQPEPTPTPPGPAFRGQEEAPVIDVSGGGGGHAMASDEGGPPVLELPLVAAPAVPIPGLLVPGMPIGASAGGPPMAAGASTAAAGARAPVIRGTLSSGTERPSTLSSPTSGQGAPTGYPRFLRSPTVAELAAVALPGVAGLLFLTFSGGVIGYRQANSSRYLRTAGAERFLE